MSTRSMLTFPTTVERASVYSRLTQSHQTWAEGWAGGAYPVLALPGPHILPKSRQVMYTSSPEPLCASCIRHLRGAAAMHSSRRTIFLPSDLLP